MLYLGNSWALEEQYPDCTGWSGLRPILAGLRPHAHLRLAIKHYGVAHIESGEDSEEDCGERVMVRD